ncbi:MAG: hypothetical protein Q7R65_01835 [bacterium]|nr:hypothetical protein [bacterium]
MINNEILGIDIGGVLADRENIPNGAYRSLYNPDDSYLEVLPFPGALDVVDRLNKERFGKVYIVSQIAKTLEERSQNWLNQYGFHEIIPVSQVHFCEERQQKRPICEKLGITHFIDDRLTVLQYLDIVKNLFWFRSMEREKDLELLSLIKGRQIKTVFSWQEVLQHFGLE